MTALQKSILFLVAHLLVVFGLGLYGRGEGGTFQISAELYVILVLSLMANLLIPVFRKFSQYFLLVFWMGLYLIYRLIALPNLPLVGGTNTYVTITELALLSITVFLSCELIRNLKEMEAVLERVVIPGMGTRVITMREASEDIKTEFVRSRRHNRPLSVVVVEPAPGSVQAGIEKTLQHLQKAVMERYMAASIAQVISQEARRTDLIVRRDDKGRFVLVLPETSSEGSQILARRIQNSVKDQLGVTLMLGSASFPSEALTFEDVLQKAEYQLADPDSEKPVLDKNAPVKDEH